MYAKSGLHMLQAYALCYDLDWHQISAHPCETSFVGHNYRKPDENCHLSRLVEKCYQIFS